jgi:hypothetical protein
MRVGQGEEEKRGHLWMMEEHLNVGVAIVHFREPKCWEYVYRLQTDAMMSHKSEEGHRRRGLTAAAETSADAIYALRSFDFPHNDITRFLNTSSYPRGIIQRNLRVVPCNGDHCRNGEAMAVDDDMLAVPVNWVIRRDTAQEASQCTCRTLVHETVRGTSTVSLWGQAETWRA